MPGIHLKQTMTYDFFTDFFLFFHEDMLPSSIRGALLAGLLILAISATSTHAQEEAAEAAETAVEADDDDDGVPAGVNCGDGLLIPIWRPYDNLGYDTIFNKTEKTV